MDTALSQKFPFILDRNLAKANCTGNRICTSCDIEVLSAGQYFYYLGNFSFLIIITGWKDILFASRLFMDFKTQILAHL